MIRHWINAAMAQSVERILGKDEVTGSIPVSSSKNPVCKSERGFYLLPVTSSLLLQTILEALAVRNNKRRFRRLCRIKKQNSFSGWHTHKKGLKNKKIGWQARVNMIIYLLQLCRGTEVVITERSWKPSYGNVPWVRIPPSAPLFMCDCTQKNNNIFVTCRSTQVGDEAPLLRA